jgi:hypothetical protein
MRHKKQGTRLLPATCPDCGYHLWTTKKWASQGTPICPVDGNYTELDDGLLARVDPACGTTPELARAGAYRNQGSRLVLGARGASGLGEGLGAGQALTGGCNDLLAGWTGLASWSS